MSVRLCEGRVAVVTGAGRGMGRAYALMLAKHGAKIVVNDLGSTPDGRGGDATPGAAVVAEIRAAGGEGILDTADVADSRGAESMIRQCLDAFGTLDVLICNAGILRDKLIVNTSEEDWDAVIRVHLRGTFLPMYHAGKHWRQQFKAGKMVNARVINTTSHSGLFGNVGQGNYAAAKMGIAGLTIVAAREFARFGVTVNAVAPRANTRLTEGLAKWTPTQIERRDPIWTAALVTWLASSESNGISGRVFESWGYGYTVAENWQHGAITEAAKDPAILGPAIRDIVARSRKNAGVDRDTWLDP
jgi:NAD(P)-dependent dehydrogenase (short-subunit alcohol dehydrogenase family)